MGPETIAMPLAASAECVFTYESPQLRFGPGSASQIGFDLAQLGAARALLVTDPGVAATGLPQRIAAQVASHGVTAEVFTGVHVEPTDASLTAAIGYARGNGPWDAIVAVGGGSSIDTAKAVNLMLTNPGELIDYVDVPGGRGTAPVNPLRPLIAVPTTAGTGAEASGVCLLDVQELRVKAGIRHPWLRPTLAVVDPLLTLTQPRGVTASAGMDILCHALESYTTRWYTSYERRQPGQRAPYCGSNPVSDLWAEKTLQLLARSFRTAIRHGGDEAARSDMALAATFAGLSVSNSGVHLAHACAHPIAGLIRDFRPPDYPGSGPLVPHGMAVALTAPETLRFTFDASPERHQHAARLLAPGAGWPTLPAEFLPSVVIELMRDIGMPNGLAAVGFTSADIPDLVKGALAQQRLLEMSPKPVTADDIARIFARSLELW
jgi:hydroxyacid-oxoacid transhydrogenase